MTSSARFAYSALAAVLFAAPLSAQDTTAARTVAVSDSMPATHTVERGDNLWDLSQRYLGNPFLWTELYRINRDVVEDPHWIYPGEVLHLPGKEPPTVVAELPVAPPVAPPGGDTVGGLGVRPQTTPETPSSNEMSSPLFRKVGGGPGGAGGVGGVTFGGEVTSTVVPTVRAGEVIVAPFVDREGGPRAYGKIIRSGDLAGVAQASERTWFQAFDRIMIEPPVGHVAPEGEKYLAYRLGPILENQGQIMVPTGVIEVLVAPRAGAPAVAKVIRNFNAVSPTDRLIPLDTSGVGTTDRPVRVDNGPSTMVKWVSGDPVQPSLQNFIVLAVTSKNGVKMGDEFVLYRPRPKQEENVPSDTQIPIAKAQVVRSTSYGVTAIIIGQEQPGVREGIPARIIARMP